MDRVTFEVFVRRAAGLLDRRSLFGAISVALLTTGGLSLDAAAKGKHHHNHGHNHNNNSKACKKRVKECRAEVSDFCERDDDCLNDLNTCAEKCCKSADEAQRCVCNAGFCDSGSAASALFG